MEDHNYEAPAIDSVLESGDVDREVHYAGGQTFPE